MSPEQRKAELDWLLKHFGADKLPNDPPCNSCGVSTPRTAECTFLSLGEEAILFVCRECTHRERQ